MDWTPQATEIATTMWTSGSSATEIASALRASGLGSPTRSSVIGKMKRLGVHMDGRAVPKVSKTNETPRQTRLVAKVVNTHVVLDQVAREKGILDRWKDAFTGNGAISIMDLRGHHCRWPFGDERREELTFCGENTVEGKPYCQAHCEIAFHEAPGRIRAPYEPTPRRNSR